ncbi:MAG: selenoneine biosynthesis selenosugar synthase SenB, partial [Thiobacillus sp.]|nr:selenoneine biosynthesis selenosugar synthase SenB [Thiobacillus sp.]
MRIVLITPYGREHRNGNWHTAARWARFLREAGHTVRAQVEWDGRSADLMLALHARRSFASIRAFAERYPSRPLLLALTGTDLYRDIHENRDAQQALELAHLLIVLQDRGADELPAHLVARTRVVYQSSPDVARLRASPRSFEVLVIGHLRAEKDPFRAALATAYLSEHSLIQVTHLGRALDKDMADTAELAQIKLPRWHWAGDVPHKTVLKRLARAQLMVISSVMEGGANVIC